MPGADGCRDPSNSSLVSDVYQVNMRSDFKKGPCKPVEVYSSYHADHTRCLEEAVFQPLLCPQGISDNCNLSETFLCITGALDFTGLYLLCISFNPLNMMGVVYASLELNS